MRAFALAKHRGRVVAAGDAMRLGLAGRSFLTAACGLKQRLLVSTYDGVPHLECMPDHNQKSQIDLLRGNSFQGCVDRRGA